MVVKTPSIPNRRLYVAHLPVEACIGLVSAILPHGLGVCEAGEGGGGRRAALRGPTRPHQILHQCQHTLSVHKRHLNVQLQHTSQFTGNTNKL